MKEKIAIFGGSFDPVHLGHTAMAREARDRLRLDRVIFLPCQQSPHKDASPGATAEQRVAMIELATAELAWVEVSTWEIEREPPSYSWMAAEHFNARFPEAQLYWLMGTDQWLALDRWAKPERLIELLTFIVFARGTMPEGRDGVCSEFIEFHHPASSTEIRRRLADSEATEGLIDPQVADYAHRHAIYPPASRAAK